MAIADSFPNFPMEKNAKAISTIPCECDYHHSLPNPKVPQDSPTQLRQLLFLLYTHFVSLPLNTTLLYFDDSHKLWNPHLLDLKFTNLVFLFF